MSNDLVYSVALAIYRTFCREQDPARAERRFRKLQPSTREQFEKEAQAAIEVCKTHYENGAL